MEGTLTSTLSIMTTVNPAVEQRGLDWRPAGAVAVAALLCWLLPGRNRRRLPAMLLVLLAIGLSPNLGCTASDVSAPGIGGVTPLGTVNMTANSVASNGTTAVSHDYSYQIAIQ
jgi:hypothetical protein